ncbi:branched-chain amino acid ABC transporter substrate-binding protein [Candidatus Poribacteria bacterium]|nr:ABC transporter substrate-binding protein [Candidatus Poribacteria bacterium]MYA72222.1 branched-chain amino acid ABC transporter substrate-binding protein [Candidatus Poribacteria bacterium]MYH79736.1 branched-chain amino acid ABC transporter substrate-binding protein [Candidatus Poribacteria bacterium]MYK94800.1 branched-chain amino acid ABC transporter substrate-binding protein [Candidatus Poribacteria bacterium]
MRNWLTGLLIIGLVSIFGCGQQKELKVAVAAPYTGGAAAFGEMIRRGAELKQKEINEAGGINGMKLTLLFEDDAGKGSEASLVAERIANNPQIVAVVGHFNSDCSLAGQEIYDRAGIVELSPGSTAVEVCEGSPWTFRNLYHDGFQGKFIAHYLDNVLTGIESVAVFFDNDAYGRGLRNAFVAEAEKIGLTLVASEAYERDSTNFKAQLTSIKAKNPDAIFISGLFTEASLIVKQGREAGITAQFFGADGVDSPDFLTVAGSAAEGTYLTTPFTFGAGGAEAKQMETNFKALHGVAPDTWAALTYDAVGMIKEALEKTYNADASIEENRKAIREHLASLDTPEEGYKGVTGLTYFDIKGDTVNKPAYVKIVKDGQFVAAEKQLSELK